MQEMGREHEALLKLRERLHCAQQAVEEEALLVLRERLRCAQQAVSEQRASMIAFAEHALQAFSREASFCRDLTTQLEGALALACLLPQSLAGEAAVRSLQREVGEVARLSAECAVWQPAVSTARARISEALAAGPGAAAVRTRRLYRGGGGEATALAALAATAMQAAWRGWRTRHQSVRLATELAEAAAAVVERGDAAAERRARALTLRAAMLRTRDASASVKMLHGAIDVPPLTERLVAVQRRVSLLLMALSVHMGLRADATAAAVSGPSAVPSAVPSAEARLEHTRSAVPSAEARLEYTRREAAEAAHAAHAAHAAATAATAATMPSARAIAAGRGQNASTELSAWLSMGGASSPTPISPGARPDWSSPGARADWSSPGARALGESAVIHAPDYASSHEPSLSSPPSPPVAAALAAAVDGYRQRRAAIESAMASAGDPEEPRVRDFLIRQWPEENSQRDSNSATPPLLGKTAKEPEPMRSPLPNKESLRSPLPNKEASYVPSSPRTPVFRVSLVEESLVDPLFAAEQAEFDRLVHEELAALKREGASK